MTTVDFRLRHQGSAVALAPEQVRDDLLPARVAEHGKLAARGAAHLGLVPLAITAGDVSFSLVPHGDTLVLEPGVHDGAASVVLGAAQLSDLVQDLVSTLGLGMTGKVEMNARGMDDFVAWEPVLRALLDGRPVHEPGMVELLDERGGPLDLHQSFTLADDPARVGAFIAAAGFAKLRGVFTPDEMAPIVRDLEEASAAAQRDDGQSWWARDGKADWYAARVLAFNEHSDALRALLHDERFAALGRFTDDVFVPRDPDNSDAAEGLVKRIGVTDGISDVPWHKDCSPGGHSYRCCGLTMGLCLTPADRESGELGVVAGSHRANVQGGGVRPDLDLPKVALPAEVGDVTIHCSCTLHMSRPPVSRERRVVYTGFGLAPRPEDRITPVDRDAIRRNRAELDDAGRNLQSRGYGRAEVQQFDLDPV